MAASRFSDSVARTGQLPLCSFLAGTPMQVLAKGKFPQIPRKPCVLQGVFLPTYTGYAKTHKKYSSQVGWRKKPAPRKPDAPASRGETADRTVCRWR
jgi:hypothetical protein